MTNSSRARQRRIAAAKRHVANRCPETVHVRQKRGIPLGDHQFIGKVVCQGTLLERVAMVGGDGHADHLHVGKDDIGVLHPFQGCVVSFWATVKEYRRRDGSVDRGITAVRNVWV